VRSAGATWLVRLTGPNTRDSVLTMESEPKDDVAEYDAKHGDPAKGKDHEGPGLTEASNKAPPAPEPFKNLKSE
jgi:hypothetical protein